MLANTMLATVSAIRGHDGHLYLHHFELGDDAACDGHAVRSLQ
jgi:hypothetical protein